LLSIVAINISTKFLGSSMEHKLILISVMHIPLVLQQINHVCIFGYRYEAIVNPFENQNNSFDLIDGKKLFKNNYHLKFNESLSSSLSFGAN